jgi:predicted RNA-binding Zn ribbon-like protein
MTSTRKALDQIRRFVNTHETPQSLRDWLVAEGFAPGDLAVREADVVRATGLREAMRALMLANHEQTVDVEAAESLNGYAASLPLFVRLGSGGGFELAPGASGADAGLARILGLVFTSMADRTWPRMKVCRDDACRWAFYDTSKNRSGAWCSMAVCGNRAKARAYRRRRRESA